MPYVFEDDGASFRVRRQRELAMRYPVIEVGQGRLKRWWRQSSPAKIFISLIVLGASLLFAFIALSIAALLIWDRITRG